MATNEQILAKIEVVLEHQERQFEKLNGRLIELESEVQENSKKLSAQKVINQILGAVGATSLGGLGTLLIQMLLGH